MSVAYCVTFDQPVTYLPDHPRGQQAMTAIIVSTDNPEDAKSHALRVTRGPGRIVSCEVYTPVPVVPSIETAPDSPTVVC